MEENVMDECNCERSEPVPVSKMKELHIVERSVELGCADEKKVESKCGHFSIRGYVAETRKRDWMISWPFSIPDDCNKLDEHAHRLPPLHVSEFRWWRCPNCLQKTVTSADTDAGMVVKVKGDLTCFSENAILTTCDDVPILFSGLQQVLQENFSEGRKGDEDTTNFNGGEHHPSVHSDAKEKEASVLYPFKDGISNYFVQLREPVSHSPSKEARVLDSSLNLRANKHVSNLSLSEKPIFHDSSVLEAVTVKSKGNDLLKCDRQCCRKDEEFHNVGFNTEIPTSMRNSASEFCHKDNIGFCRSHLDKMKDISVNNSASECHMDISVKNDDPLNVVSGPTNELNSMGLYESDHNFSESNEDFSGSDTQGQHIAGQLGTSNGILHQKKAQKMRSLNDIIKSKVSGASEKIFIFNRDAEINCIHTAANCSKAESDASKDLDLHSGHKSSLVVHEDSKKHIGGKKLKKTLLAEDKGSSLMIWQRDVAGKVKIHARFGEGKHIAPAAVNSKSVPDASTGISLHPRQSVVATQRSDKKVVVSKKENKMTQVNDEQPLLTNWQKPISRIIKTNAGNAVTKHIGTEIVHSKSAKDSLPVLGVHKGPNHRKAILNKKKKKMPKVEDGTSTLMHWLKDSLATSNGDSITDFQGHQKALQKHDRRTSKTCEEDSSDDIPMEIVELMAKNQHERRLLNAEDTTENMCKMQETTANMKVSNIMDFTENCGKEVSRFLHEKNSSVQKLQSSNAGSGVSTAGKKVGKPGKKPKGNPTHICGKYNNSQLSVNQLEGSCASKRFVPFSPCQEKPSSGVQFPATASGIKSDRWSLTCRQFLEAYHKNRTVSRESSCGQTHYDGLPIPSNGMHFDINIPHKVDDLSHKCMVCHCADPSPKRNKNANNHLSCGLKPICSGLAHHLQKQKGEAVSETNRNLSAYAFSFMGQGNEYQSMRGPLDLCTNEVISAMNLLRLMDQGACSSTPVDISMAGKQAKKPEFSHNHLHEEFFGVGDGVFRTANSSSYPMSSEFDQNHQLGSSSELLSPMDKMGELGSSLHAAASDSTKSRRHLGFISGLSNNASFSKTHGKGKTKGSHSSAQTRGPSSNRFVAQDGNLGNAKKKFLSTLDSIAQCKNDEMTQSVKNCGMTEICTINRNPAEFTIPGAGNAYMIGSEDLKYINMFPSSDRPRVTTNVDGHKRRRMMKLTALEGH